MRADTSIVAANGASTWLFALYSMSFDHLCTACVSISEALTYRTSTQACQGASSRDLNIKLAPQDTGKYKAQLLLHKFCCASYLDWVARVANLKG